MIHAKFDIWPAFTGICWMKTSNQLLECDLQFCMSFKHSVKNEIRVTESVVIVFAVGLCF